MLASQRNDMETAHRGNEPQLNKSRLLWLHTSDSEKYLLLEDEETGDVLMPLMYMKNIFETNYSRKLSSLKFRHVNIRDEFQPYPKDRCAIDSFKSKNTIIYWHLTVEPSGQVKALIRETLRESRGAIRLILLPIVYNAMSRSPELRSRPLFLALHDALKNSTYSKFIELVESSKKKENDHSEDSLNLSLTLGKMDTLKEKLFHGPYNPNLSLSKYTLLYKVSDVRHLKRMRITPSSPKIHPTTPVKRVHIDAEDSDESIQPLKSQYSQISFEIEGLRREMLFQMNFIHSEISELQTILLSLQKSC